MKHIRTYENDDFLDVMWHILHSVDKPVANNFNQIEIEKLEKFEFNIVANIAEYNSLSSNLNIKIEKYWGSADSKYLNLYKVYINRFNKEEFVELDKLIQYIDSIIPEDEKAAKKYNL